MDTLVIKPKSRANFDLLRLLVRRLGEKINIVNDKILSEALFAAEIEAGIKGGLLDNAEKVAFLKEIKSKTKRNEKA
jgi:hypothetical protein